MPKILTIFIRITPFLLFFLFFYLFDLTFTHSFETAPSKQNNRTQYNEIFEITNYSSNLDIFFPLDESIERFIRKWGIEGASVAIAYQGRLVYAKGFGYSNRESNESMQPYNLLRIASVSKLITAIAIMRLVDNDQIDLNDKVFGINGILNDPIYSDYLDSRVEEITVKQLLNHSAGWTTRWGDHLFMNQSIARQMGKELPITKDDIICFALSKRLHFTPGTRSSYNNLGYIVLERVIERLAGKSYESFVQEAIFRPLGITDAFIAFNFDSLRYPNEVRYYEVPEAEPVQAFNGEPKLVPKSRGGNDVRTLGAAGGWVISSVSLIKLLLDIDSENPNGITISQKSAKRLELTEPGIHPLGWRSVTANGTKWRTGSFAGTSALAISRNDGFTYVFLSNSSPWVGSKFPYEVNRLIVNAMQRVPYWPEYNLFDPATVYRKINLPFVSKYSSLVKQTSSLVTIKEALLSTPSTELDFTEEDFIDIN
jgi:CubicO group peptidase (beta-lactamase class C family)